jgi:predicted HTH domain antitoxin
MELTIPKSLDERISRRSAALRLAFGLFVSDEATLGQDAETAGISQSACLRELGKRRIPIHYGEEELAGDFQTVEELASR